VSSLAAWGGRWSKHFSGTVRGGFRLSSQSSRMRTSIWIIAVTVATGVAVGQQRSAGQVKVLTVCEALSDVTNYADSAVIVVGRMESSVSLIDHYEFLSQDQCDRHVVTHGHVWSDRLQIWTAWETGMPKPPSDRAKIERSIIAAKLLTVRKATKLGVHQKPQFKSDGLCSIHPQHCGAECVGCRVRADCEDAQSQRRLWHNRLRRRQRAPGDNRRAV
jgi:hypothetical protein